MQQPVYLNQPPPGAFVRGSQRVQPQVHSSPPPPSQYINRPPEYLPPRTSVARAPVYSPGLPPAYYPPGPPQPVRGVPMGMPQPNSVVRGPPQMQGASQVVGALFGGYPVYYMPAPSRPYTDYNPNFNY